ncbi:MAG: Ig-like domain-containing protein [Candidatus Latescibacterota bacterium]|nr:MAG: Ig-like domain-containing protein [Candidatus Latescibacterota bacterium]
MRNRGTLTLSSFLTGLLVVVFASQASTGNNTKDFSTASTGTQTWASMAQTLFIAAGPAIKIQITPADATIKAGDTLTFHIEVQDSSGARTSLPEERTFLLRSGATALATEVMLAPEQRSWEFFDPSDPNTPIDTLTLSAGTEVDSVLYRNTDANDGALHQVIIRTVDGILPDFIGWADVTVDHDTLSVTVSTVTATDSVVADGSSFSTVTVTLLDTYSNPVDGIEIDLTASGIATITVDPGTTGNDGRATGQLTNTVAEIVTVSATAGPLLLQDTASIVFIAGEVDHYDVSAAGSVTAGNPFNVTVEARDVLNNRVMQASNDIELDAVSPADSLVLPDTLFVTTAALLEGLAVVTERYEKADDILIRVQDSAMPANVGYSGLITVNPAAAHGLIAISGDDTTVVAGTAANLAARVVDEFDNPVAGETVYFEVTIGSGSVVPESSDSDVNGQVDATFTTGTVAGENRATAWIDDGADPQERVEFVVSGVASSDIHHYDIVLIPDETTILAGEIVDIQIQAYDGNNNRVTAHSTTSIELWSNTGHAEFGGVGSTLVGTLTGGLFDTTVQDTVAESGLILYVETQGDTATRSESSPITVTPDSPHEIVKVGGDTTGVVVGFAQRLDVEVRDRYENPISGHPVVFSIDQNPGGDAFLSDDDTTGVKTLIKNTDAIGVAWVRVHTGSIVGQNTVVASILSGTPPLETKTFTVNTKAGAIHHFDVDLESTEATVGDSVPFVVRARDEPGNLVDDAADVVVFESLPPGTSGDFAANNVPLEAGTLMTTVSDTVAEAIQIKVRIQSGEEGISSDFLTFFPDVPWAPGSISGIPNPGTITANGTSTSDVTSSRITDRYGNTVATETLIRVVPTLGSIDSPDQDPATPGTIERKTNSFGEISFRVRSGTQVGTETVTMTSVSGTADGVVAIGFAPEPDFTDVSEPDPIAVRPGDPVEFKVVVQNMSTTGCTLSTSTTFEFNEGQFAAPLAAETYIGGSGFGTLIFTETAVDSQTTPGQHLPLIKLNGMDDFGSHYSQTLELEPIDVIAIQITDIVPSVSVVKQGQTVPVTVYVKNLGPTQAEIESVIFSFERGQYEYESNLTPSIVIPTQQTKPITIQVKVSLTSETGSSTIDASVFGTVGLIPISDESLAPFPLRTWEIVPAAVLEYEPGSLHPIKISIGRDHDFRVELKNTGLATVTLESPDTKLEFDDGAGHFYSAALKQNTPIGYGGAPQPVDFEVVTVPEDFVPGTYGPALYLYGTQLSTTFSDTLYTEDVGDLVTVVTRAEVSYDIGSVRDTLVTKDATARFEIDVINLGSAEVTLVRESTRFSFGSFDVPLDEMSEFVIRGAEEGPTHLTFRQQVVNADSGRYSPVVELVGTENGLDYSDSLDIDSVRVQLGAEIRIVNIRAEPNVVTADTIPQPIDVWMTVQNDGEAVVDLDHAAIRFELDDVDRTDEFEVGPPTGFATLPGGGTVDSLLFLVSDDPSNAMHEGDFDIHGDLRVIPRGGGQPIEVDTRDGGAGFLVVQSKGVLEILDVTAEPDTVTFGQTDWYVDVTIKNSGGSTLDVQPSNSSLIFSQGDTWGYVRPDTLQGGDTTLVGGNNDTDIIRFRMTNTEVAGTYGIDARVVAEETNSGRILDVTSSPPFSGDVTVQDRPLVVIERTEAVPPFPGQVNVGQIFPVVVEIANSAGALAAGVADVRVKLSSTGGTVKPPDSHTVESIPAGSAVIDTFLVQATPPIGSNTLSAAITQAFDDNAYEESLVDIGPHTDTLDVVEENNTSSLSIDSVTTSQRQVTRGQTTPWYVDVAVSNQGVAPLAPLDVVTPSESDVSFFIGQQKLVGYSVQAPDTFLSGAPILRLNPSQSDKLRYSVVVTGPGVGDVTIQVSESWIDVYDRQTRNTQGAGTVTVVNPSGLFIDSTYADPFTAPNSPFVNSGRNFNVRVNVTNKGEDVEDVDSVQVQLENQDDAHPVTLTSGYKSIPKGADNTFVFDVALAPLASEENFRLENILASIVKAVSANTGNEVTPAPSRDREETIIIQQPADLSVSLWVSDPYEADSVSTNQTFILTARVDNNGIAQTEGPGELVLTIPADFTLEGPTPDVAGFTVGDDIDWEIRAPAEIASDQILQVEITERPIDKNIDEPAAVTNSVAIVVVDVVKGAALDSPRIVITEPGGATDSTVSTNQEFTIEGSVYAEATTVGITATLIDTSESGFTIREPIRKELGEGAGARVSAAWQIIAPPSAAFGEFQVLFDGRDRFTNEPKDTSTTVLTVEVVPAAELTLNAEIWTPPETAEDNTVPIGATFGIRAWVDNTPAHAGISPLLETPQMSIDFSRAQEYGLAEGEIAQDFFAIADTVYWTVQAPSAVTPARTIVVWISTVPRDENSEQKAIVLGGGQESISIQTDSSFVTVDNISDDLAFDSNVLPKGAEDIQLLAIEIGNPRRDADPARVEEINVSLVDGSGNVVNAPSRTITEIYALRPRSSDQDGVVGDSGQNPIVFDINLLPGGMEIRDEEADSLVFVVSISNTAELDQMMLCVRNAGDIVVTNTVSGQSLAVVDKNTLGDVAGKVCSQPLVIRSGQFEEYAFNYPNPFRAGHERTRIAYVMPSDGEVSVKIFALTGDLVYERKYSRGEPEASAGAQEVTWDGRNMNGHVVRNGIYICELNAGGKSTRIKIAVAK